MAEDNKPKKKSVGRKLVKTGVRRGAGPPPGYLWNVDVLDAAHQEAVAFLTEPQHDHLREQVKELARSAEPTRHTEIDVRPIEDFFEIRDKGGVLQRLNVRVFFSVEHRRRTLVVLSVINKQNDGPTPVADRVRARNRRRRYAEHLGSS